MVHTLLRAELKPKLDMAAHLRQIRNDRRAGVFATRRPRLFIDRTNPLEILPEEEIFKRFRFRPVTIYYILGFLELQHKTLRNCAVPPLIQLLLCLRFLATGDIHLLIGDSLRVSRSTAGRCIRAVADQLKTLSHQFIRFPSREAAEQTTRNFRNIAGFPNVVGCIDGTHVRIMKPTENEADFVNRKGYHSLNVQMCCDAGYKITSVNASWPGSVHDSRVFRTSALCAQFEAGEVTGYLLGDSGYPCRRYLLTPLLDPNGRPEERYNGALCRTRVLIEQTFGILKRRFQCLHYGIRACPKQAVVYIMACAMLHNLGINHGDIIQNDLNDLPENEPINFNHGVDQNEGVQVRRHIINTFLTIRFNH